MIKTLWELGSLKSNRQFVIPCPWILTDTCISTRAHTVLLVIQWSKGLKVVSRVEMSVYSEYASLMCFFVHFVLRKKGCDKPCGLVLDWLQSVQLG